MFVVILIGAVPLVLMTSVIRRTVRNNILKNTIVLTNGILDQSQKQLNVMFNNINLFSDDLIKNRGLLESLDKEYLSSKNIELLSQFKKESEAISSMVVFDMYGERKSVLFNSVHPNGEILIKDFTDQFFRSQQALLLKENNSRSLWLGMPPKGIGGLTASMWNYRVIKTDSRSFILAISISANKLKEQLHSIELSISSDVRLITSDNVIYPSDNDYFDYTFAPKTLSRSNKGRFISFSDSRITNGERENLLIQLYFDPVYFYNLIVLTPEKKILKSLEEISRTTTLTLVLLTLISIGFGFISISLPQKRVKELISGLKSISLGELYISSSDCKVIIKENYDLTKAIMDVAEEVSNNRNKLNNMNNELEKRVQTRTYELNMTRESLIHSEKMAIIGHHAAKIAHEINNPLGISITASSVLSSEIKELKGKIENNNLTKSYLSDFSSTAIEIISMIEHNLTRATQFSTNFKNFASDQSSNDIRSINVKNYIDEIVKGYGLKLKDTSFVIKFICDDGINLKTRPTIIYQIITNLINNSLLHGFDGREEGVIDIEVIDHEESLEIVVKDDGFGISEDNLIQLYQPFFTTKYGAGGTGLGLNIVKDLIVDKLNGTINCYSTLGEFTRFVIEIPKKES